MGVFQPLVAAPRASMTISLTKHPADMAVVLQPAAAAIQSILHSCSKVVSEGVGVVAAPKAVRLRAETRIRLPQGGCCLTASHAEAASQHPSCQHLTTTWRL